MKFNEVFEAFLAGKTIRRMKTTPSKIVGGTNEFDTYQRTYYGRYDMEFCRHLVLRTRYIASLKDTFFLHDKKEHLMSWDDLLADDWEVLDDA